MWCFFLDFIYFIYIFAQNTCRMKTYNYKSISKIFFVGDIHGEFNDIFYSIRNKTNLPHELEATPHPWLEEDKGDNSDGSAYDGEINSKNDCSMENSVIIFAGDCGLGFNKLAYYEQIFNDANKLFSASNTTLLFMRGNHDDPAYFEEERINFSHIKTIPDYSVILTQTNNILCIGGAISIDRSWRKSQEIIINRYSKSHQKKMYWDDEGIKLDMHKLNDIFNSIDDISIVVTHSAPKFVYQTTTNINDWLNNDSSLYTDLQAEDRVLTELYYELNKHFNIKLWEYGHFHMGKEEIIMRDGHCILFTCLSPSCIDTQIDNKLEAVSKIQAKWQDSISIPYPLSNNMRRYFDINSQNLGPYPQYDLMDAAILP